jgi:hypothetical protein
MAIASLTPVRDCRDCVNDVFAYAKSEQSDLTPEQRRAAARMMKEIKDG